MNTKKQLKSGAMLEIQMASFYKSRYLLDVLAGELKKVNINIDDLKITTEIGDDLFGSIKNLVLNVVTSENLRKALDGCFERCLYNDNKVNEDLFDSNIDARSDYFIVCWEVIRYNVSPFMKGIDLKLITSLTSMLTEKQKSIQKLQ